MLGGHDDGSLVVGVVLGEIADGFQDIGSLVGGEDVVSSPDLDLLDPSHCVERTDVPCGPWGGFGECTP